MNEDDRNAFIIALYNQAMEDIRDRRRIEWQTFAVVNVIYLGLLKVLYDYKGTITPFWAAMFTIAVWLFTWIWCIRIHANVKRMQFPMGMRDNIQCYARRNLGIPDLIPCRGVGGGWSRWKDSWPLWRSRGIIVAIFLYAVALTIAVVYKTRCEAHLWQWVILAVVTIAFLCGLCCYDRWQIDKIRGKQNKIVKASD